MKVYIGPYKRYWTIGGVIDALLTPLGVSEDRCDAITKAIGCRGLEERIHKWRKRKIRIKIDEYDMWSADHTLAMIITPMLIQLRENPLGYPLVDLYDVPQDLQEIPDKDEGAFRRWDWILGEMIFAFEMTITPDWEEAYYSGEIDYAFVRVRDDAHEMVRGPKHTLKIDQAGLDKAASRIENGHRLFGRYYANLWS